MKDYPAAASGEQDEDAEPEAVLPPLAEGQTFDNPAAEISERYTQPPKAFTEDTLLSAMESAGKEDTPEDAERKGLGTTATRAGIIEKLISAGFAERKGKKLIPTKDGYNLVAILPDSLTSPQLTAEWETRLTGIAKGSDSPADFMRGIEEMTAGLVKTYPRFPRIKRSCLPRSGKQSALAPVAARRLRGQEKLLLLRQGLQLCDVEE